MPKQEALRLWGLFVKARPFKTRPSLPGAGRGRLAAKPFAIEFSAAAPLGAVLVALHSSLGQAKRLTDHGNRMATVAF